ncbi:serine protease, trypsin-like protein [Gottschalkia acidurici 9a]|uniref:Serine protease, trypsin-like protein n=2 Tax=Clostridium acidurici TaxID=1556 RepID=K0AWR6_GOTA9|nr:serine protease, trypsin-like protein [Gottschalkia acidurici 9a]
MHRTYYPSIWRYKDMKIKSKVNKLYKEYVKGNSNNILLVVCISGFIFGFFLGYLLVESDNMEQLQALEASSEKDVKQDPIVKIAKEASPSIVVVKNKAYIQKQGQKILTDRGIGSGVVYKKDGYIITNQHVVRGASAISIVLDNGEEYEGRIIGEDAKTDLAVIKIDKNDLKRGNFGNSDDLKVGERAIAIGSPIGQEFSGSVTSGIISATNRSINIGNRKVNLIQTDAAINPGNSGGALINENGEIVGINSLKIASSQIEGMAFAIPINTVTPIVDELIVNGYIKRPWLGLGLKNSKSPEGVYIGGISKNGPADKSNLAVGDIIVKINTNRVRSTVELSSIIEKYDPNDKIKVTVKREQKEMQIDLILGETSK